MSLDINQILIQIVAFLLMLWILKKFGWQPLLDILHQRQKKIQEEFDTIATQKDDIKKLVEQYQEKLREIDAEARSKIQEAILHGRKLAAEIQAEAQVNAKEIVMKARHEIDREVSQVKNQLKNDLVKMTIAIAEKILNENLDETKHQQLITEFVEEAELR